METCRHPESADLLRSWVVREKEGENGKLEENGDKPEIIADIILSIF